MDNIRQLINSLEGKVEMMALTSSGADQFEAFRHEHQLAIPYYFADATVLKTIVTIKPGDHIVGKWYCERHVASQRYS